MDMGSVTGISTSKPALPQSELEQLLAFYRQGRFAEMAQIGEELEARYASSLMLHNLRGAACVALGNFAGAETAFRGAIEIDEMHAELHNNLGAALEPQGKLDEAAECYTRALALNPNHASAHYNLGNVQREQHALSAAIASYERAITLKPSYVEAYNNLGLTTQQLARPQDAIAYFTRALELKPECPQTLYNLATALMDLRDYGNAVRAFELVLAIRPDHFAAARQKAYAQIQICDFSARRNFPPPVEKAGQDGPRIPPFIMLALDDDPGLQLLYSRNWARATIAPRPLPVQDTAQRNDRRIRVGYFSADFHDHATMSLMAGLFREYDRQRFEIFAYSYGRDSNDAARTDLLMHIDRFIEIREIPDSEVLSLVRTHQLDIAVELKGYTRDSRSNLFAGRLAPVQINFLGYPGSMGNECMDYLIADPVLVPPGFQHFYSEKIIYLPGSYQPNDNLRSIGLDAGRRTASGLPQDGFVFCCFNQAYKIGPAEFTIWMRLLRRVEGSVLWLLRPNAEAQASLQEEAGRHGVDPDRLVFADCLPNPAHLARLRLADLFLDTFHYNAHTTASDALWAGLPVVTKAGRQFAARVGASLLHATGLPDLVTECAEDYEALALELATSPDKLAALRSRLAENRLSHPLFDTRLYAGKLEAAYLAAHERYRDGLAPAEIVVA
jgi:predicted O-linked N-acetylglucosamine transferase (SPINDLY family)